MLAAVPVGAEGIQYEGPSEPVTLTFWNGFTGTDGDVLKEIVAEYNATNTLNVEIQVEIMPWDSLYQKLATALPVGEGPDIIAYNTEYIASYAESGALAVISHSCGDGRKPEIQRRILWCPVQHGNTAAVLQQGSVCCGRT